MRISDWSSDVCSSDLLAPRLHAGSAEDWLPQAGAYARLDMHYYEQLRWIQAVLAAHPPRAAERAMFGGADMRPDEAAAIGRSEEHTSELQSLMRISYADFCLRHKKDMRA